MAVAAGVDSLATQRCLVVAPDADTVLLARAIEARGIVLSNDRFVDHRKMDGLDRATLIGWSSKGRGIEFHRRPLDRLLSALISLRQAKQDLKDLGLHEDSPELRFKWWCRNDGCEEELVALPMIRGGSALCPECDSFLFKGSEWADPVWLKFMCGEIELARAVIEHGESLVVGRAPGPDGLVPAEPAMIPDVRHLDDRHAQLANHEGRLTVRDLGSDRGTAIRPRGPGKVKRYGPPMPVGAKAVVVRVGDKVVLGKTPLTVQITRAF